MHNWCDIFVFLERFRSHLGHNFCMLNLYVELVKEKFLKYFEKNRQFHSALCVFDRIVMMTSVDR